MTSPIEMRDRRLTTTLAAVVAGMLSSTAVDAAPAIRTSAGNSVPQCVTPERLMAFVAERNPRVDPRYRDIAHWYKYWGDAWHVRWDYAFYQMVLETNYLSYRRANGDRGDVHEMQNNFAGIGATGGGVAGERFPDIKTGVLAQIQHLVAYSGEKLAQPIAERTQSKQDDIVEQSRRLRRSVTFGDLARRWATDRQYGRSIDVVSDLFRKSQCSGTAAAALQPANIIVPSPQPARRTSRPFPAPSGLGGPKPQQLAGPEPLPEKVAKSKPKAAAKKAAPPHDAAPAASAPQEKSHPPVRTIWSRSGAGTPQTTPSVVKPAEVAPQAESSTPPVPVPTPQATAPAPAPTTGPDEPAGLPQFKINPIGVPPLRLGGPSPSLSPPPGTQLGNVTDPPARPAVLAPTQRMGLAGPGPPAISVTPAANGACKVLSASYGGNKTLLVKSTSGGVMQLTALTVIDGFEKTLFETYAKASAPNAEIVGEYASKDEALAEARANCEGG